MENDQELLDRADKERREIVSRYDKGRDAEIDPWDEPDVSIYSVTDRYGFIHDQPLPRVPDSVEAKILQIEKERTKKWLKMIKKWETSSDGPKMASRIYKGIPNALRGDVWTRLLDIKRFKREQVGVYQEMRQRAREWSPDIRQIDLDVNRTYRDNTMFRARYDFRQQALFHVLAAYSMYNTEVGYCQGMSQIAALLLMYLNDEEDAFWALSALLSTEKYGMHGFFIPGFPKLLRFQDHHDRLLKKFLPKVKKHLAKNDIYASLYTIKWFLQCFLDRVPFPLTLRLWDIWMLEGEKLLTAMSYNLLKMHRRRLLKMNMEELISFVQGSLVKNFGYSDDQVIDSLKVCMEELRKAGMELPPKPARPEDEKPQKPFGLFVPPSVEQLIGRRTMESEQELIRGKRRSSSLRPVVPADGGSARLPSPITQRLSHASSSRNSPAADSNYDTATTDGFSSRASYIDYQSSRTSFVGSDIVSTSTTGAAGVNSFGSGSLASGRTVVAVGATKDGTGDAASAPNTAEQIKQVSQQLQHISRVQVTADDSSDIAPSGSRSQMRHSPSLHSQYDNVNDNVNTLYEQNLESTLNDLELEGTPQKVTVNGHETYNANGNTSQNAQPLQRERIIDHRSYSQASTSQSRDYHSHTEQVVHLNGPAPMLSSQVNGGSYEAQHRRRSPAKSPHGSPTKSPSTSPPRAVVIPIQRIQSPTSPTSQTVVIPVQRERTRSPGSQSPPSAEMMMMSQSPRSRHRSPATSPSSPPPPPLQTAYL